MTRDPIAPRPNRRSPRGLLGMLALVACVELTISARRLDFTTVWADDWRGAERAASRQGLGRDVLCFGDSLVKFGVLPKEIRARTGLKAYNLAVNAGTVPSTYMLLKRALDAGARPRAIVVDFFALMQPDRPRNSTRMYPDLATTGEVYDLARFAGDFEFFNGVMTGKLLPSAKCRFEIRESVRAALKGRRASPWPAQAEIWGLWKAHDGAQPMPVPAGRPPADPVLVSDISPPSWTVDPINARYAEKFLKLAQAHGIPVFWAMLPLSPEVQALRDRNRTDEAYDRYAREVLARHPEVVVVDARRSRFDGSAFYDPIHLNVEGARAFTAGLAAELAARLEGHPSADRWVALPAQVAGIARVERPRSASR